MHSYSSTLIFLVLYSHKIQTAQKGTFLDGPMYPYYSTNSDQMYSFASWPTVSKQKPEYLSNSAFFRADIDSWMKLHLLQTHFLQENTV
jgi:hypothetical protein